MRVARELFVYWHVAGGAEQAAVAEAAVRQMQGRLREAQPMLVARLYRRMDDARCTLMETYALPGAGVSADLQQQIEAAAAQALAAWCTEGRHTEVFEERS